MPISFPTTIFPLPPANPTIDTHRYPRPTPTDPVEIFAYIPHPYDVSLVWGTSFQLIMYLFGVPSERQRIMNELRRHDSHPCHFIIYHPLLKGDLIIHSLATDSQFHTELEYHLFHKFELDLMVGR